MLFGSGGAANARAGRGFQVRHLSNLICGLPSLPRRGAFAALTIADAVMSFIIADLSCL
jgi:hypothetical protein